MRHTSIRLSDEHMAKIAESGESPSKVIRKALDTYFDISLKNNNGIQRIIDQAIANHMRQCSYHKQMAGNDKPIACSAQYDTPQEELKGVPNIAHKASTNAAHYEHGVSTDARPILSFILDELRANKEPLLPDVAAKFNLTALMLTKTLKPYGVRTQKTSRAGIDGKYFTQAMRPKIEEILRGFS